MVGFPAQRGLDELLDDVAKRQLELRVLGREEHEEGAAEGEHDDQREHQERLQVPEHL